MFPKTWSKDPKSAFCYWKVTAYNGCFYVRQSFWPAQKYTFVAKISCIATNGKICSVPGTRQGEGANHCDD